MTDVITRHGRNGSVLFVSPAAEQLFGVRASDLSGHGMFDRVHVADRPAFLTALADAAAQGEARSVEFRIRRDGDTEHHPSRFVWVEMRCRPFDQVSDKPNSGDGEVVAVLRDISERKVTEQAIGIARAEQERANASKSRFLAMMSHELRTPLNAIKFTPRGGRTTVSAQCEDTRLAIAVEDTGVGIGEADLPRLGEAFFQARASYDRRHDGSGLGLSIVKGLVKLHGGDIDIRSRLGEGTRVTVRLPIDCEGAKQGVDPIHLVTERADEFVAAANVLVKKSA
jgi:PAS domain S-box-containing protein